MRPTFDRRLWILLYIVLSKCIKITDQRESYLKSEQQTIQPTIDLYYENEQQSTESVIINSGHKLKELADIEIPKNLLSNTNRIKSSLCANCNEERLTNKKYYDQHSPLVDWGSLELYKSATIRTNYIKQKQKHLKQKQKQQKQNQNKKFPNNDDNNNRFIIANLRSTDNNQRTNGVESDDDDNGKSKNHRHLYRFHDNSQKFQRYNPMNVKHRADRKQLKKDTKYLARRPIPHGDANSAEAETTENQGINFDETSGGYSDGSIYATLFPRSTKHSYRHISQKYINNNSTHNDNKHLTKDRQHKKNKSKNQNKINKIPSQMPSSLNNPAIIKTTINTITNTTINFKRSTTNSSTPIPLTISSLPSQPTSLLSSSMHKIKIKENSQPTFDEHKLNLFNRHINETQKTLNKFQYNNTSLMSYSSSYFNENDRVRRSTKNVLNGKQMLPLVNNSSFNSKSNVNGNSNSNSNDNSKDNINGNSENNDENSQHVRRTDNNIKLLNSSDISKSDIRYKMKNISSINKNIILNTNLSATSTSSLSSSSYYSISSLSTKPPSSSIKLPSLNYKNFDLLTNVDSSSSSSSSISSISTSDSINSAASSTSALDSSIGDSSSSSLSSSSEEQKLIQNDEGTIINNFDKVYYQKNEPIIIIDDAEEFDSGVAIKNDDYQHDEPRILPLRPIIRGPYDDSNDHNEEFSLKEAEQHTEITLKCDVYLNISTTIWYKNGQIVHAMDQTSRVTDYRFIKDTKGGLTITNVMLEDDGKWQCEAENTRGFVENARPIKLVVLDRPKPPYLLIDSRRLDAGNIFVPVKENSELNLACVSEGGNPRPTLTWEVLLSPGVDRHAQKVAAEVLELEEIKNDKDKLSYKINSGAKSEARLPAIYRAHHNARILCVMEHPTLKIRLNASLLLDVQYTPSFAISRTPGFGYPLREGIEVSLKCDVDSNPPSSPRWMKDDGDTPVAQIGDGFLNFTSIRREHSGWYKCTSRHLNFQYSSIGYYLSVRYESVDVTSEPEDQEISVAASHNPNKGQMEVQLGGAVTLQCPQGSLGCWSHLDPVTARLRGLGTGLSTPSGQFSLKDVVYQDAGTYKCIGQSPNNKKKLEVLQTVGVLVKGAPTATARNATPIAYPGSPLHLAVEFCANPAAHAARWLHGDRVYTPGNQYGSTVLAYGVTDLPTPFCKEARLTYVSMHERVPRTFYFIVSSPGGVAEATFKVNFTLRYRSMSNSIDEDEEELSEPEEIHFPVFGSASGSNSDKLYYYNQQSSSYYYSFQFIITKLLLLLLLRVYNQIIPYINNNVILL